MKGYTYIEKDRVVVNTKKKPPFYRYHNLALWWSDSCIEVENVKKIKYRTHTVWYYTHDKGMTEIIPGELYECKKLKAKIIIIDYI